MINNKQDNNATDKSKEVSTTQTEKDSQLDKILEKVPEDSQKVLKEFLGVALSSSREIGIHSSPLENKITSENIDNLIEKSDKHDERVLEDKDHERKQYSYYFFGSLGFVFMAHRENEWVKNEFEGV